MSASLVGSEMCIRDSPCTAQFLLPLLSRLRDNLPAERGWRGLNPVSPVSYTHLTLPTICSV
eukprot:8874662-Alexandrium_andersonii.AAC.1